LTVLKPMINFGDTFGLVYNHETQRKVSALIAAPFVVAAVGLGINFDGFAAITIAGVPILALPFWIMNPLVHDHGKAYARRMYRDGAPTTVALRLRSNSGYQVDSKRTRIQQITGVQLLSRRAELANPHEADARIIDAVDVLRAKLRNHPKCQVLRKELRNYGFWRNMVANRNIGMVVSVLSAVVGAVGLWLSGPTLGCFIALAVGVTMFVFWLAVVRNGRFAAAGERYKDELFRSMAYL